jgi:hypothetical protein
MSNPSFHSSDIGHAIYDHTEELLEQALEHVIGLSAFRYPDLYELGDGNYQSVEANNFASFLLGIVGNLHVTQSVSVSIVLQFVHDWTYTATMIDHCAGYTVFNRKNAWSRH